MSMLSVFAALSIVLIVYVLYFVYKHNTGINYHALRGANILLTGASMGIGEQMAYELAKGGASLFLTGLEHDLLQTVAAKCEKLGAASVQYSALDLSVTANCRALVAKVLRMFEDGRIDFVFLNHALIGPYQEWINLRNMQTFDVAKNIQLVERTMPINICSHMILATLLYRQMESSQCRLVYTSSLAGYGIQPYVSVYSASKHGISAFFENWRTELAMNASKMSITICKLSMVSTQSAMSAAPVLSQAIVDRAADPRYVATRIISGGQQRLTTVYAPLMEGVAVCVITKISKWLYIRISCKANYNRFW